MSCPATFMDDLCLDALAKVITPMGAMGVSLLMFAACFYGLAKVCDNSFAPALEVLCARWNIPDDVAGATFLALGSSAPELVISGVSALQSLLQAGSISILGFQVVLGSGMTAFSAVPGIVVLATPQLLVVSKKLLVRECCMFLLALCFMIGGSYLAGGPIPFPIPVAMIVIYTFYVLSLFKAKPSSVEPEGEGLAPGEANLQRSMEVGQAGPSVAQTGSRATHSVRSLMMDSRRHSTRSMAISLRSPAASEESDEVGLCCPYSEFIKRMGCPPCEGRYERLYPFTFFAGLAWIAVLSQFITSIVNFWVSITRVSVGLMGLTLVAYGGQIPDTLQSITVARHGHGSMAMANCIASQTINILLGIGIPWLFASILGARLQAEGKNGALKLTVTALVLVVQVIMLLAAGLVFYPRGKRIPDGFCALGKKAMFMCFLFYLVSISGLAFVWI